MTATPIVSRRGAVTGPAVAHFKLVQPGDALESDDFGDPIGGEQKSAPCGRGTTKTGVVTQVRAGDLLHIKLIETVPHGGHYRIALASNRAEFADPEAVIDNGDCVSAATSDVAPVLADGLFEHAQDDFGSGQVWETDVRMPNTPCPDCTLQVIEFMTPHPPSCFYHHCARIEILPAPAAEDAGAPLDAPASEAMTGGCEVSGRVTPRGHWLLLSLLAVGRLLERRRRR